MNKLINKPQLEKLIQSDKFKELVLEVLRYQILVQIVEEEVEKYRSFIRKQYIFVGYHKRKGVIIKKFWVKTEADLIFVEDNLKLKEYYQALTIAHAAAGYVISPDECPVLIMQEALRICENNLLYFMEFNTGIPRCQRIDQRKKLLDLHLTKGVEILTTAEVDIEARTLTQHPLGKELTSIVNQLKLNPVEPLKLV